MTEPRLTVLLADDHQLVAEVIASHLAEHGEFQTDTALSLPSALQMARAKGGYDVVLLDFRMPGMDGMNGLTEMLNANFGKPVAMLSGNLPPATVKEAMRLGAASCIPKSMPMKSLINAVRFIAGGGSFLPVASAAVEESGVDELLTEREKQVLSRLSLGLTNKEIGRELSLSEITIKMHVRSICAKLDVKNRTQAALVFQRTQNFE